MLSVEAVSADADGASEESPAFGLIAPMLLALSGARDVAAAAGQTGVSSLLGTLESGRNGPAGGRDTPSMAYGGRS